ncbi:histidinol-phosphate transaminase [Pseudorhodoferax sp. Leaf267]|uniref:histidinol-phosphate transaminase n=1 Tax=Pseudorhodoferax sp. Leaf267 TaxID=1736316 RepID=UPI0006F73EEF|nr:histidinol-phosphate transaminase [Pseudorhodoferax sp. Leaf267]KQP17945.1 histidinol-phosphate aminotransferase [Pseudorhodoferax sp. Leaf267]
MSFTSPHVQGLAPYTPGEQPAIEGLVKLNTNENPYPPSPRVLAAIDAAMRSGLQLYPDPASHALCAAIARTHAVATDQVFVGNGSDEVLAFAFDAFFRHCAPLLLPDITYSFYASVCRLYGITAQTVPVDAGLRLDLPAFAATAGQDVAGMVVANPNAPTGIALPLADIEQLARLHPQRVLLVDEAYVDFGAASAIALIDRCPNVLVVQTLSKSRALAGLRVGFAIGQRPLIEALERVKNSFNAYPLDRLAQAGAIAAFEDQAYFEQQRQAVMHTREGLLLQLEDLGFEVLPSQANFLFVRHPAHDAAALATGLRAHKVLVRHFAQPLRIAQYLRISIGTPAQCERLLQALAAIV